MKHICYLSLLLLVFISCKEQNKTTLDGSGELQTSPNKYGVESQEIPTKQSFLYIPWVDPALVFSAKGC